MSRCDSTRRVTAEVAATGSPAVPFLFCLCWAGRLRSVGGSTLFDAVGWNRHEWLSRRAKRAAHELRSRALCIAYISQRINSAAQRCTARAAFVCCADGVCGVDLRLRARRSTPAEPSASLSISCTPSEVQSLSHSENVARCSCSEYSVRTVPQQPQPPEVLRGAAVAVVRGRLH